MSQVQAPTKQTKSNKNMPQEARKIKITPSKQESAKVKQVQLVWQKKEGHLAQSFSLGLGHALKKSLTQGEVLFKGLKTPNSR
jgi:hypothetical protein